jgi:hypothetical protein
MSVAGEYEHSGSKNNGPSKETPKTKLLQTFLLNSVIYGNHVFKAKCTGDIWK